MSKQDLRIQQYSTSTTMKDIAALANVSIGTVDRALNNRGRINAKTKQAVLDAAASLNYVRNDFAKALQASKKIKILVIVPSFPSYNDHLVAGFKKENELLSNYGLALDIVRPINLDAPNFLDFVNGISIDKYDGLIMPATNSAIDTYIDKIKAGGVEVATVAADSSSESRLFYSGENPYRAGCFCGELCAKLLNGKGNIGFFCGQEHVRSLTERTRGFIDIINSEYPGVSLGKSICHDDDLSTVHRKAEAMLLSDPLPDLIFCNSAVGALPLCETLEKFNIANRPLIVGYDDDERLLEMIKKGVCTAMLYQNPEKQAQTALHHLFFHLYNGTKPPSEKDSIIDPQIIMKGNINICM